MKKLLLFSFCTCLVFSLSAAINPDDILGVWRDSRGKGEVQIFKQNGKYYGQIVGLKKPLDANGQPRVDKHNPNPSLRNEPVLGLLMLKDFKYKNGEWSGGRIYNPSDGKEYKAYMKLKDKNTLNVRGYIGFSLLGKTDTWVRVK